MKRLNKSLHRANSTRNVNQMMAHVLIAALPAEMVLLWAFGFGPLINLILACTAAVLTEGLLLKISGKPLLPTLADNSALVSAMLIALTLPPLTPWWLTLSAVVFAIAVVKHVYGGLGYNLFNPAMAGFCLLIVSFPEEMSRWPSATSGQALTVEGFLSSLQSIMQPASAMPIDFISQASPLDQFKTSLHPQQGLGAIHFAPQFTWQQTALWQWLAVAFAVGGLYMLVLGIITWTLPLAVILGIALPALLVHLWDSSLYPGPLFHLLNGATLATAFFIATDPVTAAASRTGRWIYGIGIGLLSFIIRTWGAYPDGFAFAVLIMNMSVPFIDKYTVAKPYGTQAES